MAKTVRGIVKGIRYALEGYAGAFREDKHFRINLFLSLSGTILSLLLVEGCKGLLLAFINYLVLAFELVNTALERSVDTATTEFKPTAKLAKDTSAAAVLTVGVFALLSDLFILVPEILGRL